MLNKKGLSAIVTTLIIILLVLVAIGIVWAVVRNLIGTGSEGVDINAKCIAIDVRATKANCSAGVTNHICDVTLTRTGTGEDQFAGVKLVFKNDTASVSTAVLSQAGNVAALTPKKITGINTGVAIASSSFNKVDATVYFEDASGNDKNCQETTTYTF